jgi:hypothetical protein
VRVIARRPGLKIDLRADLDQMLRRVREAGGMLMGRTLMPLS